MSEKIVLNEADKTILRQLGEWKVKTSETDENQEKIKAWTAHDAGVPGARVMVRAETWYTSDPKHTVNDSDLLCENQWARNLEKALRFRKHEIEVLRDDNFVIPWIEYVPHVWRGDFGVPHSANLAVVPGLGALTGTAEFRLYFWGAADSASVAGVGKITDAMDTNVSPIAVDAIEDIVLSGTASYSAGTVGFAVGSTSVVESAGSVVMAVARTGGSSGAASVDYAVVDGTALAGSDYTATTGTLTWADGVAGATLTIVDNADAPRYHGHR